MGSLLEEMRRVRVSKGLTMRTVARKAGFSEKDLSRWELGQVIPSVLNFVAVANALEHDVQLVRKKSDDRP